MAANTHSPPATTAQMQAQANQTQTTSDLTACLNSNETTNATAMMRASPVHPQNDESVIAATTRAAATSRLTSEAPALATTRAPTEFVFALNNNLTAPNDTYWTRQADLPPKTSTSFLAEDIRFDHPSPRASPTATPIDVDKWHVRTTPARPASTLRI
jgi:hypothetical protein